MYFINSYRFGEEASSFIQYGLYDEDNFDAKIADGYVPIATAEELNAIRTEQNRIMGLGTKYEGYYDIGITGKKYVVYMPIDLSEYSFIQLNASSGNIFDGNNCLISNYTSIEGGLFYKAINLYNVRLSGVINYTGTDVTGGIADILTIVADNCVFYGSVTATAASGVGGIAGSTTGVITNSTNYGTIQGLAGVGGVCGYLATSVEYTSIYSRLNVNHGNVTGTGNGVGGIFGYVIAYSKVSESISTGVVTGSATLTGGFTGYINSVNALITNCKSTGSCNYAGFIGRISTNNTISYCYSTGVSNSLYGFAAILQSGGAATACYWDTTTSGTTTSAAGTGKTTTEMQNGTIPDTTIYVGWSSSIWDAGTTTEYPELISLQ